MTLKLFMHIIGCVMYCKLSVQATSVLLKRSCHFPIHAAYAQRHGVTLALSYYPQPAYMHAEYLPIIHHHLQTLLAPSLRKTEAWRLHHPPSQCPASEQWFWPMASGCYLLRLHFYLTYYVTIPESTAKPTYRDTSGTVIAQACHELMSKCCLSCQAKLGCYKCEAEAASGTSESLHPHTS